MARSFRFRASSLALLLSAAAGVHAATDYIRNPLLAAQPEDAPAEVNLAVEIPAGSFTKYETNDEGLVFVDRFQSMPVAYPGNYGSLPRSGSVEAPEQVAPFLRVFGARKREEVDVRPRPSDDAAPGARKNGPPGWTCRAASRRRAA